MIEVVQQIHHGLVVQPNHPQPQLVERLLYHAGSVRQRLQALLVPGLGHPAHLSGRGGHDVGQAHVVSRHLGVGVGGHLFHEGKQVCQQLSPSRLALPLPAFHLLPTPSQKLIQVLPPPADDELIWEAPSPQHVGVAGNERPPFGI